MNKFFLFISTSFTILACIQCTKNPNVLTFENGFPDTATNFSIVNSEFDDYNSAKQGESDGGIFMFSSNRNSKGKDFDIVQYGEMVWDYDFGDGTTTLRLDTVGDYRNSSLKELLKTINTQKNEFGPYILDVHNGGEFLLFYAQEDSNKLNLKFTVNTKKSAGGYMHYPIYNVNLINEANSNEAYISIDDIYMYYCSDKTGNFDVYQYPMNRLFFSADECVKFLTQQPTEKPIAITSINSISDDKCPYVTNNFMVFSSNREGGLGGYDLWYSKRINGTWTKPENFGPAINSKYDEYRPIVKKALPNDLMIFSSNRPGGKGGFDLYYVGINRGNSLLLNEIPMDTTNVAE